jgi:hypothetical protein
MLDRGLEDDWFGEGVADHVADVVCNERSHFGHCRLLIGPGMERGAARRCVNKHDFAVMQRRDR